VRYRRLLGEIGQHLGRDLRAQGRTIFRRISCLDVAEQSFQRVIVRLGNGKGFAGRCRIGAAQHSTETAKAVSSRRMRRCIGTRWHIAPLPGAKISRATITTSTTCNSGPRIEAKPAMPSKSPCPNGRPNRPAPRKPAAMPPNNPPPNKPGRVAVWPMGAALPGCVIEFWIGAAVGAVVNAAIVGQPWSDHDNPTRNFIACQTLAMRMYG
jgi:hypothetical protein